MNKDSINKKSLEKIEKYSKELGIIEMGYTKVSKDIVFEGNELNYSNAIVFTIPIKMTIINEGASLQGKEYNSKLYDEFLEITIAISNEIKKLGFKTQIINPREKLLNLVDLAKDSGIGYKGRSGLLISEKLGPRLKIAGILTSIENLPFNNKNTHKWIENYCKDCKKCEERCPEKALKENSYIYIDNLEQDECTGSSQGCIYCIKECPFYLNGYNNVKKEYEKIK